MFADTADDLIHLCSLWEFLRMSICMYTFIYIYMCIYVYLVFVIYDYMSICCCLFAFIGDTNISLDLSFVLKHTIVRRWWLLVTVEWETTD